MPFQVQVQPSGRQFAVNEGETVLQAGMRQNIGLPYGCKDGACGSCKCQKLSGQVTHKPYQPSAMTDAELAQGMVLTCCAVPASDVVLQSAQVTAAGAFAVRKMPARVMALHRLSPDVMQVSLQLPANAPLQFHAGQYIDVLLADGQRRSYSLATAPHQIDSAQPRIDLHIRHMPGGTFTDHVFAAMKEKEILRVEGAFGNFYLHPAREGNGPLLFLASGTGFAPVKAMLEQLAHDGNTRPVVLYWGARRPHDLYMHQWMLDYVAAHPHVRYVPVISDALPEDVWGGCRGLAMQALLDENPDMRWSQLYSCGTPAMVHAARALSIEKCGLLADAFFADAFTSQKDKVAAPVSSMV